MPVRIAAGCLMTVLVLTACLLCLAGRKPAPAPAEPTASAEPAPETVNPTATPEPVLRRDYGETPQTGGFLSFLHIRSRRNRPEPEPTAQPEPTETLYDFTESGLTEDSIVNPFRIYSYWDMYADLAALEERYPDLISVYSIGTSVEGRDLPAFDFGRGDRDVIIAASMHACEHMSTNVIMYLTDRYCQAYEANETVSGISCREILDGVTFHIVPMVNPDGVTLAQFGLNAVSDPDSLLAMGYSAEHDFSDWKSNINGVDLNGNFLYKWGLHDEVNGPCEAGWAGPSVYSEPETRALQTFTESIDYDMLISLHIRGEAIYWVDTDSMTLFDSHYGTAKRFARAFNYALLGAEDVTERGGYYVNSERIRTGRFCCTLELCPYVGRDPYPTWMFPDVVDNVYSLFAVTGDEVLKTERQPLNQLHPMLTAEELFGPKQTAEERGTEPAEPESGNEPDPPAETPPEEESNSTTGETEDETV